MTDSARAGGQGGKSADKHSGNPPVRAFGRPNGRWPAGDEYKTLLLSASRSAFPPLPCSWPRAGGLRSPPA